MCQTFKIWQNLVTLFVDKVSTNERDVPRDERRSLHRMHRFKKRKVSGSEHLKRFRVQVFFIEISVTRVGEISPLWHNLTRYGQIFESLFSIWHSYEPTLANVVCHWANFQ